MFRGAVFSWTQCRNFTNRTDCKYKKRSINTPYYPGLYNIWPQHISHRNSGQKSTLVAYYLKRKAKHGVHVMLYQPSKGSVLKATHWTTAPLQTAGTVHDGAAPCAARTWTCAASWSRCTASTSHSAGTVHSISTSWPVKMIHCVKKNLLG